MAMSRRGSRRYSIHDVSRTTTDGFQRASNGRLLLEAEFALTCAECGNTVTREEIATRIDSDPYQLCCSSCEARFEAQYERMEEEATG